MEWGCPLVIGESEELTQRFFFFFFCLQRHGVQWGFDVIFVASPIFAGLTDCFTVGGKGKRPDIEVRARVVDPMVSWTWFSLPT